MRNHGNVAESHRQHYGVLDGFLGRTVLALVKAIEIIGEAAW